VPTRRRYKGAVAGYPCAVSSVHLVADSTCDIAAGQAEEMGITIVPLKVIIGDEVFADGVDIDPPTLYARMRSSPVVPRTSQPTPSEFEAVFAEIGRDGTPIVCTTISADMSGTYGSAVQARAALPDLEIRIIDTRTVGPAHRQVVERLHQAAMSGAGPDELEAIASAIRNTQRLVFTVESLEYLRRGGRIGGARALLGSMLNIKPILELRGGVVEPLERVRTFPRALDRLHDELRASAAAWGGTASAVVTHADVREAADRVAARAAEAIGGPVAVTDVGPVIGCHGGPGAIGIAFHKPLPQAP
jgi:DegV family protein with EDD domain